WQLVAHGEHWGAAGGTINAQIASVLIRKPLDGTSIVGNESVKVVKTPWKSDLGGTSHIRRVENGETTLLLKATTQVSATDYKGKGGVSIALEWPERENRPAMRVDFVCAHLDSETVQARHYGIAEMLSRVSSYDQKVSVKMRKDAVGKSGEIRQPCGIFDRDDAACNVSALPAHHLSRPPTAVVVMGDLNYRLAASGIENFTEDKLVFVGARKDLSGNDRLVKGTELADILVKDVSEGGFGFQCNMPFELYPPTYKRSGGEACKRLGEALQHCGTGADSPCNDSVVELAASCYVRKDKNDIVQWPTKKDDLQLGWLDRFCFRTTGPDQGLHLGLKDEEGWTDYPGPAQTGGSDHMPVAATLLLTYDSCKCSDIPPHMTVAGCEANSNQAWLPGQKTTVTCAAGHVMKAGLSAMWHKFREHSSAELTCSRGGILRTSTRRSLNKLECIQACTVPYRNPDSAAELIPSAAVAVPGEVVTLECPPGTYILGVSTLHCRDAKFVPEFLGRPPTCVNVCHVGAISGRVWMHQHEIASAELATGPYRHQIETELNSDRKVMLEGGRMQFACREHCLTVGNAEVSCQGGLQSERFFCGCQVGLKLAGIEFDDTLKDDVEYVKLQYYRGHHMEEQLKQLRRNKGYEHAEKFKPEELASSAMSEFVAEQPAQVEVHLTLCAKSGKSRGYWSHCGVIGQTSAESGQNLQQLLKNAVEPTGTVDAKVRV
ncbi:unnamed protein product, partial [Effrenium voratum]